MHMRLHVHVYLRAIRYKEFDKADYQGGVRYTKNVLKQIVKVNYNYIKARYRRKAL